MNYFKNICLALFLVGSVISCTEIYNPDISSDTQALVVEGLITNDSGPYTVKLSMAKPLPFDSVGVTSYTVRGATVTITDNNNKTYSLSEYVSGTYITSANFQAKIGDVYKLHIKTKSGNIYESNPEKLLPPQTYDSVRGFSIYENYVNSDNEVINVAGADVRLDLFSSCSASDSVPACRFSPLLILQYWYTYRDVDNDDNEILSYHWVNFGWKTYKLNSIENISEEKIPSINPSIQNHSICFIPYNVSSYALYLPSSTPILIYYLKVNQYTLNHDSYRFYKSANNQLSASGKLFDPISSQLYSNMNCLNDASKIVVGLFEVSSVKKYAFALELKNSKKTVLVNSTEYLKIPETSFSQYKEWDLIGNPPDNDSAYIYIPLPDWWYHQ